MSTFFCAVLAVAAALLGVAAARRNRWLHATLCGTACLLAIYVALLTGLPVEGITALAAAAVPGRVPVDAPDGHRWVRLAPAACPDCSCCTARLCEQGQKNPFGCSALVAPGVKWTVQDCPCSAETTEGTAAHEAVQVRAARRAEQEDGGGRG
ncbi:hypothetical protein [Streptosporangium sp. NPDC051022]|uniref:hypothetical protein n=1 Tax=Streptosporangium sp. NPDC051022 TaxID=3155752 RepID=UPI003435BD09